MSRIFSRLTNPKMLAAATFTGTAASLAYSRAHARSALKERSYSIAAVQHLSAHGVHLTIKKGEPSLTLSYDEETYGNGDELVRHKGERLEIGDPSSLIGYDGTNGRDGTSINISVGSNITIGGMFMPCISFIGRTFTWFTRSSQSHVVKCTPSRTTTGILTVPDLKTLDISGATECTLSDTLGIQELCSSGASHIKAGDEKQLRSIKLSGSSDTRFNQVGNVNKLKTLENSSFSALETGNIKQLNASGSSKIRIDSAGNLNAIKVDGTSRVTIDNAKDVTEVHADGASRVHIKKARKKPSVSSSGASTVTIGR